MLHLVLVSLKYQVKGMNHSCKDTSRIANDVINDKGNHAPSHNVLFRSVTPFCEDKHMDSYHLNENLIEKFNLVLVSSAHWIELSDVNDHKQVHKFEHHDLSPRAIFPVEHNIDIENSSSTE